MHLNKAVIPHYRSEMIPIEILKKKVSINEGYLREKPTWYEIEGRLQYFKIRNDFRLFTEQFFSMFGREIMGLDTLDYRVAYVRTKSPIIKQSDEKTQCGLLSDNFQSSEWWRLFWDAIEFGGLHHWEAENYANEMTGEGFSTLSVAPRDCPSIANSCYISLRDVFPKRSSRVC